MTDTELEHQARLWHVESTLDAEKTQRLQEALTQALPRARARRVGRLGALVLVAVGLPVSGITAVLGGGLVPRQPAQLEPLLLLNPSVPAQSAMLSLAQDGTVLGKIENQMKLWRPSHTQPEPLVPPVSVFPPTRFRLKPFSPSGVIADDALVGTISLHNGVTWGVLYRHGQWLALPPLPGYASASCSTYSTQGPWGYSEKERVPPSKQAQVQPTLWRNGKPEPSSESLSPPRSPLSVLDENAQGEQLVDGSPGYQVLSGNTTTAVALPSSATPLRIGKGRMLVGRMLKDDVPVGAIWLSPSTPPQTLWESASPLGHTCSSCEDIDDDGKVVGLMTSKLTGESTPYLWKAGRYLDLQTLVPRRSGWKLLSASRVNGRFVIGEGTYQGKPAHYRLTLPPGVP
ncbi:hypothetical protein [Armatimonas rosea]|uniref:Uncharacterized protein n=1 Tax=Armatimonas rosea TaxID=685828 RepID=A0A7W9W6G4_ARMRO|nr:hypothetical protein [Armatimonas rosea]MBB6050010.1 hypothetical protein [Armatimonas rosea]